MAAVLLSMSVSAESGTHPNRSAPPPKLRIVDFAPGVRIDWASRVVEVRAKVALRRGPLELFACSARTREYESVLVVAARPLHIFQALGLLGTQPGHPPHYDEKSRAVVSPAGEHVSVSVRFGKAGGLHEVPARDLVRVAGGKEPPPLHWVFSGSRWFSDGGFAADAEGTVACVVDFDSAVLSLARSHSADNDQLWLSANTPNIPPVGTACVLLIRVEGAGGIVLSLDSEGRLRRGSTVLTPDRVVEALTAVNPGTEIRIVAFADPPTAKIVRAAVLSLVQAGVDPARIKTTLHTSDTP